MNIEIQKTQSFLTYLDPELIGGVLLFEFFLDSSAEEEIGIGWKVFGRELLKML